MVKKLAAALALSASLLASTATFSKTSMAGFCWPSYHPCCYDVRYCPY
ncbi:MAG: hypothetical protein HQK54_16035 [Oligoflexales bacterium]|nr:hypothetical protein [Oligoflexales bacterium]